MWNAILITWEIDWVFFSLSSQNGVSLFTRLGLYWRSRSLIGSLCRSVLRGDERQDAGLLLETSAPPRPFHPLWWRACPESLSSASYGPGENYGYILNENGKAVKAGSGVGDRLKSMKRAGPFWSPIIICGTAKCPFKKLWKGLCQNCVPWEQCWWGIAGPPGWCKWRPLHKD